LVVTDYKEGTTPVYIREDGNLLGIGDIYERNGNDIREQDLDKKQKCSFCAVSIVSPPLLTLLPQEGFSSIIDAYHKALSQGLTIGTYYHNGLWEDIGDKSSYRQAYIKLFSYLKKKDYNNIETAFSQLGL
jgi:NDP-sugar pyrophosphorylase family protein